MSYNLTLTNGTALTTVLDGTIDTTSTSINLIGKNYAGYGLALNENFIEILENFSNSTAPLAPLQGQLWWDSVNKHLAVYQGSVWKVISSSQPGATAPLDPVVGDVWYDTSTGLFKVYSGSQWVAIGPTIQPGSAQTALVGNIVTDTSSSSHLVGNVVVNNKLGAIFSTDSAPFVLSSAISGISTVRPGLNFSAAAEPTMLSSPNTLLGVTGGNLQISTIGTNYGITLVASVGGSPTTALYVNGINGQVSVASNPTANLSVATKQYVDNSANLAASALSTTQSNLTAYTNNLVTTTNAAMASYVNSQITTANTAVVAYTNNLVFTTNAAITSYVNTQIAAVTGSSNTNTVFTSNLVPSANLSYNIGSATNWWNEIYGTAIHAQYADLAERFSADQPMLPGTVVELGGPAEITAAVDDLSESVFGVISTAAAYLMNSRAGTNESHPPVAVQGRVPVRVIGVVRKGERLVSAGRGLARAGSRSEINTWNVIGRALEDKLDPDEGTIEAVVKLNS